MLDGGFMGRARGVWLGLLYVHHICRERGSWKLDEMILDPTISEKSGRFRDMEIGTIVRPRRCGLFCGGPVASKPHDPGPGPGPGPPPVCDMGTTP